MSSDPVQTSRPRCFVCGNRLEFCTCRAAALASLPVHVPDPEWDDDDWPDEFEDGSLSPIDDVPDGRAAAVIEHRLRDWVLDDNLTPDDAAVIADEILTGHQHHRDAHVPVGAVKHALALGVAG